MSITPFKIVGSLRGIPSETYSHLLQLQLDGIGDFEIYRLVVIEMLCYLRRARPFVIVGMNDDDVMSLSTPLDWAYLTTLQVMETLPNPGFCIRYLGTGDITPFVAPLIASLEGDLSITLLKEPPGDSMPSLADSDGVVITQADEYLKINSLHADITSILSE